MFPLKDDNPTQTKPVITIALISFCVIIFLFQYSINELQNYQFISKYGMVPQDLFYNGKVFEFFTICSSMFLHGGILHLLGNMLFLWIYGNNIEDSMGHTKFFFFYILCGIAAALTQALIAPFSDIPMIGASGAVAGILSAYLLLFPRAKVSTLVFIFFFITVIRIPAGILILIWLSTQLINANLIDPNSPGVAWFAHIGGFCMGALLIPFFKKNNFKFFSSGHKHLKKKKRIRLRFRK
jgi:membrane associated rhomboid family serine protease